MNTKIERTFDCFLMKTFCVETNYKNLYGWGVWAVIAAIFWCNKAEAFSVTEKFNRAFNFVGHIFLFSFCSVSVE